MKKTYALITGASSGIGLEIAKSLAKRNYNLVLTARRENLLKSLAEELRLNFGVEVDYISCDLTDPKAPEVLYDFCKHKSIKSTYWSIMLDMRFLLPLIKLLWKRKKNLFEF